MSKRIVHQHADLVLAPGDDLFKTVQTLVGVAGQFASIGEPSTATAERSTRLC
ncbi:hypothetical protein [Streptomyces sp. NPDC001774]